MDEDIKILNDYLDENDKKFVKPKRLKFLQAIENLINKNKEQQKMIEMMAKELVKEKGNCPVSLYNIKPFEYCENICTAIEEENQEYKCIINYFRKKAKGE